MTRRDTGFPADVVEQIWIRDGGCCARCGRGLVRADRGGSWAIHHREPRGRGGAGKRRTWVNLAANGVCLCTGCHDWVEKHRAEAVEQGWLVSAIRTLRPVDVPVVHVRFGVVRLTNEGGTEKAA